MTQRASDGVNVVGYFRTENGVGESARLLVACLEAAKVPFALVGYGGSQLRERHSFSLPEETTPLPHATTIACVNASEFAGFRHRMGASLDDTHVIGRWHWEVNRFPASDAEKSRLLNEVWVTSSHEETAISAAVDVAVSRLPLPVIAQDRMTASRAELGLPDRFLFLFCYDALSVVARKNPVGLVRAFVDAFPRPTDDGPVLVLKSVNLDRRSDGHRELLAAIGGRRDVILLDGYLSVSNVAALMSTCDAYVSLHRSEGFGLTIAEAMALGKPCVATGYSGNLEFMDEANSYLVPYTLVPVGSGRKPYPADASWAEPDLGAAAALLRHVWSDRDESTQRGQRAAEDMRTRHSPEARVPLLRQLLDEVDARRSIVPPMPEQRAATLRRRAARALTGTSVGAAVERRIAHTLRRLVGWEAVETLTRDMRSLHATPFTTVPLRVLDPDGRLTIGFHRGVGPDSSVRYAAFESVFRGSEAMIRDRQRVYVPLLAGHEPVLDLGAGRGELLDLLAESGIDASAVDLDADMAAAAIAKGHDVVVADAATHLAGLSSESLGAVVSLQFVEHIDPSVLQQILDEAFRVLRPGGRFIAETVNPHAVAAWKTFWTDLSHVRPIFPETLCVLAVEAGFDEAYVLFPNGTGDINRDLSREGEYAVVATKKAST